jgi:hypothetical protein
LPTIGLEAVLGAIRDHVDQRNEAAYPRRTYNDRRREVSRIAEEAVCPKIMSSGVIGPLWEM